MSVEVRRLAADEAADAVALLEPEGWAFTADELRRLHHLGGAVGAFRDGRLVGFLSFVDFQPVRWVGNVVVHADLRGEGVGARMVDDALRDARTVGLYAVEKAVTLYERAGFAAYGEAWALRAERAQPRRPAVTDPMRTEDLREVARLDREATAMDRGYLVRALHRAYPDGGRVVRRGGRVVGYGFAKTSPGLTEIGPVVSTDATTASAIMDALLALTDGPHEMTVLGDNPEARSLAEARGFAPAFRTVLMFHGKPPAWQPHRLHAAAGLEKG